LTYLQLPGKLIGEPQLFLQFLDLVTQLCVKGALPFLLQSLDLAIALLQLEAEDATVLGGLLEILLQTGLGLDLVVAERVLYLVHLGLQIEYLLLGALVLLHQLLADLLGGLQLAAKLGFATLVLQLLHSQVEPSLVLGHAVQLLLHLVQLLLEIQCLRGGSAIGGGVHGCQSTQKYITLFPLRLLGT